MYIARVYEQKVIEGIFTFSQGYTPYSKIAAILVFFCLIANWPFWPSSKLNVLLNLMFKSEAKRANLQGNKRILEWRPFWN